MSKKDNSRYATGNDIKLVDTGPIALFSNFKLTTSSAKQLEYIIHAHIEPFRYKLLTSSKDSDDLSFHFDLDRNRKQNQITKDKVIKRKYHVRIMLMDVSGFAQNQEKITFGMGYKKTLTRKKVDTALQKAVDIADARIESDHILWYIPHCISSTQQQGLFSKQNFSKTPTEHRYVERSVLMKELNDQNLVKSELANQESMNNPEGLILAFQQSERKD